MYLLENEFAILKEEIGQFHYFEERFSSTIGDETNRFDWKEIDTLIAYKENRNITDEICLDIFKQDAKILAISESIPGWFQFIKDSHQDIKLCLLNGMRSWQKIQITRWLRYYMIGKEDIISLS